MAMTASTQEVEPKPTWFVFLVTGDNPPKANQEEIAEYQKAHLNNFKRLFGEGKLLTAGPLQDKAKIKRGIVVFSVKTKAEVIEGFKPDPYIQKGFMKVEAFPLSVEFGRLNTAAINPNAIVENRIVVFEAGDPKSEPAKPTNLNHQHLAYLRQSGPKAGLSFYASLADAGSVRAVALFKGKDDAPILEWLKAAPLVRSGQLRFSVMPQWLSDGVL